MSTLGQRLKQRIRKYLRSERKKNLREQLKFESLENRRVLATTALQITVENLAPEGVLANTPVWVGLHNGTFDVASLRQSASRFPGLEALAEEGDTSGISEAFQDRTDGVDTTIVAPDGFAGAPIFEPGEIVEETIDVEDPEQNRYFSFASMIIPSNDAFIGNLNPRAYQIFNARGDFRGPITIDVFGEDIWDAGTEENNPQGGAAFSTEGGDSVDEGGRIHQHEGLDDFLGTGTPIGAVDAVFTPQTPIARITISLADDPSGPIDNDGVIATLQADDVTTAGEATHSIQVTYSDPSGVDVSTIDPTDLRIFGRSVSLQAVSVSTDAEPGTSPRTVVATYEIPAPGGEFDAGDSGRYFVYLRRGGVADEVGNRNPFRHLGSFHVDIAAEPVELQVEIENLAPAGGLFQTPFWVGFHEGRFDVASIGRRASRFPGLEALAEEGDTSGVSAAFAERSDGVDTTIVAPDGFPGAPVFDAGEIVTENIEVDDPRSNRYFSFASMIIPSNDAFIANLNPRAYQLFNSRGDFRGPLTIEVYGDEIWDAGTEVNDPFGGAAFSTEGGDGQTERTVIRRHRGLDDFVGTGTPVGDLETAFTDRTPIARITISLSDDPSGPIDRAGPEASLNASNVTDSDTDEHEIEVTFVDPSGVDLDSISENDIQVVRFGRSAQFLQVTDVEIDATNPREVVATYTVESPGDTFTSEDNGRYYVSLNRAAVSDDVGNVNRFDRLGSFLVDVDVAPVELQIQIENLAPEGGLYQTPFWLGFHDGRFDLGSLGRSASRFPGLEELAEEGDTSVLSQSFQDSSQGVDTTVLAPEGFGGAPIFDPGETVIETIEVPDPQTNRYFSFASMLIPSNDAFLANLNSRAYRLFNSQGTFRGPITINLYGEDVWDAGTEVNDPFGGAAFSTEGGTSVDENGRIRRHSGLDDFIDTNTPAGPLDSAFTPNTPLARITISLADDPSQPIDERGPRVEFSAEDVTESVATQEIHVTFTDPSGVDVSSIDPTDLQIRGFNGTRVVLQPTSVTTDAEPGTNPRTVEATYVVSAPDGAFTPGDNGRYTVYLNREAVADEAGNSTRLQRLGTFEVDVAAPPVELEIEIENLAEAGGLFQTPFWVGVHEGRFDVATIGASAARFPGLEELAEEGDTSVLSDYFQERSDGVDSTITSPGGFPGAPVFDPGEIALETLTVDNPQANRYFSFASMIIPSNDAFLANLNPRAYQLFNRNGEFVGPVTIELYGADVWDAGTEVNDPQGGAAFSTEGGESADQNGRIRRHPGLDNFVGTGIPTGGELESAFDSRTPLAKITIRRLE